MTARQTLRAAFALFLLALLAWSVTGCTAPQIDSAAAYLHGRVDEYREADRAKDRAKREGSKRVHCRTSLPDLFTMPHAERHAYLIYCGWIDPPAVTAGQ